MGACRASTKGGVTCHMSHVTASLVVVILVISVSSSLFLLWCCGSCAKFFVRRRTAVLGVACQESLPDFKAEFRRISFGMWSCARGNYFNLAKRQQRKPCLDLPCGRLLLPRVAAAFNLIAAGNWGGVGAAMGGCCRCVMEAVAGAANRAGEGGQAVEAAVVWCQ